MGAQSGGGTIGAVEPGKRLDIWQDTLRYENKDWLLREEVEDRLKEITEQLGVSPSIMNEILNQVVSPAAKRQVGEEWWHAVKMRKFDNDTFTVTLYTGEKLV